MPLALDVFADTGLNSELLDLLITHHEEQTLPQLNRLWSYYRNPAIGSASDGRPRLAQECGLPPRLRPNQNPLRDDRAFNPEPVIENDIAWRIDALVDFVFGKPVTILSTARNQNQQNEIARILDSVIESSGGIALLQDMMLLGSVHGHVDLLLRTDQFFQQTRARSATGPLSFDDIIELARLLTIELIEAPRAIPILDPADYRNIRAYIIRTHQQSADPLRTSPLQRALTSITSRLNHSTSRAGNSSPTSEILEIHSHRAHHRYENRALISSTPNPLALLPVVHIQNASQPFHYPGLSDVEPLIAIQNELNTRLSDRAHRVTLQSFKMYLAKGLDGLASFPVAPGQVWSTDNPTASIHEFGGDSSAPSELTHIEDLRDAMDKISSISPVALGVIRAKLGHLSSENALRITLNGVLSKTERKRATYGRGITQLCRMILRALDVAGIYRTQDIDRGVRLEWPDPLPLDQRERLTAAQLKRDLGVPIQQIHAELGIVPSDAGVI